MAISDTIAAITSALDETRADLARVNVRIEELQAERRRIEQLPPHADDIAAVFLRGLNQQADLFERQFKAELLATYTGANSAEAASLNKAPQLLRLEAKRPDREELMTRSMKGQSAPDLNVAALSYFLHAKIASEIPALVDKLCPSARDGLPMAARRQSLAEIDDGIALLVVERDRLSADLEAVRAKFPR